MYKNNKSCFTGEFSFFNLVKLNRIDMMIIITPTQQQGSKKKVIFTFFVGGNKIDKTNATVVRTLLRYKEVVFGQFYFLSNCISLSNIVLINHYKHLINICDLIGAISVAISFDRYIKSIRFFF